MNKNLGAYIDETVGKTIQQVKHMGQNQSVVLTFTDGTMLEIMSVVSHPTDDTYTHLEFLRFTNC